jgi:hypothetical protein
MLSSAFFQTYHFRIQQENRKNWLLFILFFSVELKVGGSSKQGQASDCDMAMYHEQLLETHHYQIHSLMPAENNDCTIIKEKKIQD